RAGKRGRARALPLDGRGDHGHEPRGILDLRARRLREMADHRARRRHRRRMMRKLAALAASAVCAAAFASDAGTIRVNTFPNAKALPFHAGLERGIFARRGVALELSFTENS